MNIIEYDIILLFIIKFKVPTKIENIASQLSVLESYTSSDASDNLTDVFFISQVTRSDTIQL